MRTPALMRRALIGPLAALIVISLVAVATADVPSALNFSGRLEQGAGAVSGDVTIDFVIYDDATSTAPESALWWDTLDVVVDGGAFHVLLGGDPANAIPDAVFAQPTLYIGMQVEDDAEMSPRLEVASVPYARVAGRAANADALGALAANEYVTVDQVGTLEGPEGPAGPVGPQGDPGPPGDDGLLAGTTCPNGEILQFVSGAWGCSDHVVDPNAHHSSTSDGLAISPSSVALQGTATSLTDGALDLGPGAADELTAAMVETLTGAGDADALHTHAGSSTPTSTGADGTVYKSATGEPVYMGVTTVQRHGGFGLGTMNNDCHAAFPGSRMCTDKQIFNTYPAPTPEGAAWVFYTPFSAVGGGSNQMVNALGMPALVSKPNLAILNCASDNQLFGVSSTSSSYKGLILSSGGTMYYVACSSYNYVACCGL